MRLKTIGNIKGIAESIGVSFEEIRAEYAKLYGKCSPTEFATAIALNTKKNPKHERVVSFAKGYLDKRQTELDTHIVVMNNKDYENWQTFLALKRGN